MKTIEWILDLIKALSGQKFSGHLTINFFKGGVTSINKTQTFKPPAE